MSDTTANRVLIDTNLAVDSFLQRAPFSQATDSILRANSEGLIIAHITALSLSDIYYLGNVVRRREMGFSREDARKSALQDVRICLETFEICAVDAAILKQAYALPDKDFEDNIQVACAVAYHLDAIVTRDKKFPHSPVPVLTPAELLKRLAKQRKRK